MSATDVGSVLARPAKPSGTPLLYLPIGFFGAATGTAGLGYAWGLAHVRFGTPLLISNVFISLGLISFFALLIAYAIKATFAPRAVLAEFRHPITGSLFNLVPIGLVLFPITVTTFAPAVAVAMWWFGAAACLGVTWLMVYRWLSTQQQVETAAPAWLVAVAGPLNLPIAIPALGLTGVNELAVFALGLGLFLCVPVFTVIFSRLLFQTPPPTQARAAFLVLTAPFSLGYSAYVSVTGRSDLFAESLFMVDLFLLSILFLMLRYLQQNCPFWVAWWAVSFPLAAATNAAFRFASIAPGRINDAIAIVLLGLTTAVVIWLFGRTLIGIVRGDLRALLKP